MERAKRYAFCCGAPEEPRELKCGHVCCEVCATQACAMDMVRLLARGVSGEDAAKMQGKLEVTCRKCKIVTPFEDLKEVKVESVEKIVPVEGDPYCPLHDGENSLYFVVQGRVFVLDLESLKLKPLPESPKELCKITMAFANGCLFVRSSKGLYKYDTSSSQWQAFARCCCDERS